MKYSELPIKVQGIVYRQRRGGDVEILLLKRSEEDGGFWQMLTGTMEMNESVEECLVRELREETGITNPKSISEEVYRFSWQKADYAVVELVFGIEVFARDEVKISHEHQEYQWVSIDEAASILPHQSGKNALQAFEDIVLER